MLESKFKKAFLQDLQSRMIPHGFELDFIKVDPPPRSYPDCLVLGPRYWAALEFKRETDASQQPNQGHHVKRLNDKGYSSFVYPENAEVVLNELERLFTT